MSTVQRVGRAPAFLGNVAVAGVGYSEITTAGMQSVLSLALDACGNALADAGMDAAEVDGVSSFSWADDSVPSQAVATGLALPRSTYLLDVSLGGQAAAYLVMLAGMAIHSGIARNVLVYRALRGRSGQRVGTHQSDGGSSSYRYPLGLSSYAQVIAMWARRYLHETGSGVEDLAAVPIAQRAFAEDNPRALRRTPLDMQAYLDSPPIAEPFRAADCTVEVDGACAVLVTSLDRARDLRHPPAVVHSAAYSAGPRHGLDASDCLLWEDLSRNYTSELAPRLWAWAEMQPNDVDCAQLYDCFSSSVLMALEGLGFADRGGAGEFVRANSSIGGRLPINTNGGLLCEGYLHGMNTLAEAVLQVQCRAATPVPDAESCIVTSGAMMDGSALILVRE